MEPAGHTFYMARCIALAQSAGVLAAPNPMVGAVLVHDGTIIGEGCHQKFGGAHAEVNCIENALVNHADNISSSTLYVSLEPCVHYGKTPPCTDLIIAHKVPRVVIGCRDSFDKVNGQGIEKLRAAGIEVIEGVLQNESLVLNKRFFTSHRFGRPYISLKWAQSADGFIADGDRRLLISNNYTNRLVHKWRSEEMAVMVGATTAINDNPVLNNRYWFGKAPVKILLDPHLRVPQHLNLFNAVSQIIILNTQKEGQEGNRYFVKLNYQNLLDDVVYRLSKMNIQSILIEGGQKLLQSFINAALWDEARIITNTNLYTGQGLASPIPSNFVKTSEQYLLNDRIEYFVNGGYGNTNQEQNGFT